MIPWLFVITGLDFGMFGTGKDIAYQLSIFSKKVCLFVLKYKHGYDTNKHGHHGNDPSHNDYFFIPHFFYYKEYMHLVSLYTDTI